MKNLVLVVGLVLACTVGSAQEKGGDIPREELVNTGSSKKPSKAKEKMDLAPLYEYEKEEEFVFDCTTGVPKRDEPSKAKSDSKKKFGNNRIYLLND